MIFGALAAAAAAAYWYTREEDAKDYKAHAQASVDEAKRSAQSLQVGDPSDP